MTDVACCLQGSEQASGIWFNRLTTGRNNSAESNTFERARWIIVIIAPHPQPHAIMVWLAPTVNTSTIYNRWKFNRRGRLIKSINNPPPLQNHTSSATKWWQLFVCLCLWGNRCCFFFFYLLDLEEPRDTGSRCAVWEGSWRRFTRNIFILLSHEHV